MAKQYGVPLAGFHLTAMLCFRCVHSPLGQFYTRDTCLKYVETVLIFFFLISNSFTEHKDNIYKFEKVKYT